MKRIIKITLMSDLCAGSGYSYAGVVDTDVVYDECGVPYIPARRIKGCLRETAEMIGEDADALFGKWGQDGKNVTPVSIYDARIENYTAVSKELNYIINKKDSLGTEDVLKQYTSIKAQTKIDENGSAKKNTLRFTRVVNQTNPMNNKPLVFEAQCFINDEKLLDSFEKVVRALRHIGFYRNRGLGNVKCELQIPADLKPVVIDKFSGYEQAELKYTIVTDGSLMLSSDNESESETSIPGQMIHGFFANQYLKTNEADEEFDRLFLHGDLLFSPLYISDKDGCIAYPVPSNICRLKKSKKFVNTAAQWPQGDDANDSLYGYKNGNQPKKLKGKYLDLRFAADSLKEVEMEVVYHNRHQSKDQEKQLYISQAIKQGQYFTGSIVGKADDIILMADVLEKSQIILGKSRTAQYGKCSVVHASMKKIGASAMSYKKGTRLLVTFTSDAMFIGENGYTVRKDEVRSQIRNCLGIVEEDDAYTEMEVKNLTGFYGVWNLHRQPISVVCAGSTFEFVLKEDCTINPIARIGVKTHEGFGMFKCYVNSNEWKIRLGENCDNSSEEIQIECILPLLENYRFECVKADVEKKTNSADTGKLNSTTIGKLSLMLSESIFDSKGDYSRVRSILQGKIDDIKDTGKRSKTQVFVVNYYDNLLSAEQISELGIRAEEMKVYGLQQALVIAKYKSKEAN